MNQSNNDMAIVGAGVDRRLWLVLTEASAVATVAVLPYLLQLQGDKLAEANEKRVAAGKRALPVSAIGALTFLQSQVTYGVPAYLGLRLGRSLGLGAPWLAARLRGRATPDKAVVPVALSVASGAGAAVLTLALDTTVFRAAQRQLAQAGVREPQAWRAALATFYGAIAEEVLMRLGLQTMLAAGLARLAGEQSAPGGAIMWPAILLANLAFGAGHLPAVRGVAPVTPALVARTLVLNSLPGSVFGALYWRRSLEAAMLAHGAADVVLHIAGPRLASRLPQE
jgi:membrane protease YdiL (CAAX protease family)